MWQYMWGKESCSNTVERWPNSRKKLHLERHANYLELYLVNIKESYKVWPQKLHNSVSKTYLKYMFKSWIITWLITLNLPLNVKNENNSNLIACILCFPSNLLFTFCSIIYCNEFCFIISLLFKKKKDLPCIYL